ncbi:hypothetical protein KY290_000036 [Solanum tuberosum]|uniref:Uncharacterized protein n=1 Tax=Solanum tuberosum TaxID=4113 RepID=A0ABQ7WIC9_SOLTU|nr:hypothetical protein KY289_000040 [Solanum tuberosum]KAH0780438.1 hypothetical protein KY290_000036 [Solanum tuberosum]
MPSSCNDEVFLRIPNLKKLGILIVDESDTIQKCYCLENLVHLTQLEKLKVEFRVNFLLYLRLESKDWVDLSWLHIPHCDNFPPNLKKLTLCRTNLQWEDMSILTEQIQEEQQSFGNDDLIIRVNSILEKTFLKKIDDEGYHEGSKLVK